MENKHYLIPFEISDLCSLFYNSTNTFGELNVVEQFDKGRINKFTYSDLKKDVSKFCMYLTKHNFNSSYIFLSGNLNYTWLVSFFSIILVSSKVVCIDKKNLNSNEVVDDFRNMSVSYIISEEEIPKFFSDIPALTFEKLDMILKNENFECDFEIPKAVNNPSDEIAVVLFTSGTTGSKKAVYLTHRNITDDIMGSQMRFGGTSTDRVLSFLPAHHAFELTVGILTPFFVGASLCISRGLRYAMQDIKMYSPTIMPIVPLIAKTIQKNIEVEIRKQKKEKIFLFLIKMEAIPGVGKIIQKRLFKKVVSTLGGNLKTFICGGSTVTPELQEYFRKIGFCFFYGYGITECSPVVCFGSNSPLGSVGVPLPFCEVLLIDGELCVKGSIVAKKQNSSINQHMEFYGDWYKTGDLGYIDDNGNIFITGRKKELIILDNGENVSPAKLEGILENINGIEEIMICATTTQNGMSILTAVVNPNKKYIKKSDSELQQLYYKEINDLKLPNEFKIGKIIIIREPFPHTNSGKIMRTETMKLLENKDI